jgi:hypothetical protein
VQSIKGTDDIMGALCRHLVEARNRVQQREAWLKGNEVELARSYAQRDEGFFRNIWYQINGERQLRHAAVNARTLEATEAGNRLAALARVVDSLARRPSGDRIRFW